MTPDAGLAAKLPAGCRLVVRDAVGSTNDEARALAHDGAPDLTLVWAKEQLAGRGRRGRTWRSPPGNLYLSVLLRPTQGAAEASQLGFVAALAIADAVDRLLPQGGARLKWPNDVLLGEAKVAGVLMESAGQGRRLDWLILGLGVNIGSHPENLDYPATSLTAQGGAATVPEALAAVAHAFVAWRERWQAHGFGPLRDAWLARAHGLGDRVEVKLADTTLTGTFADLDRDGALVLRLPGGATRTVTTGDVLAAAA